MSESLRYSANLRKRLEAEFGGKVREEIRPRERVVLAIVGASSDEYEFAHSAEDYFLRRWRRWRTEKHQSPKLKARIAKIQREYL